MPATADTFTNFAVSTVAGGAGGAGSQLNAADTTCFAPSGDGAKFPATGPFYVMAGTALGSHEIIKVNSRTGDQFTSIVRGQDGTTATTWPVGTSMQQIVGAVNLSNIWAAINRGRQWNALDYGAKGDGVTNDGPAVRAMMAAIQAAGGGTAYFPAGTYLMDVGTNPEDSSYNASFFVPSNVLIRGDSIDATTLKLAANSVTGSRVFMNWHISSGDTDISLSDLTVDGNGANQTLIAGQSIHGALLLRVRGARWSRVRFLNCVGTATSGAGESFTCDTQLSTDIFYSQCECVATTGNTDCGFSASSCTNVHYVSCSAWGMSVNNGFTHNSCRNISHSGCYSYLNGGGGFNSEVSNNVSYSNCFGGVFSTNAATYPYSSGTDLGNSLQGFILNGSTNVRMLNCSAEANNLSGLVATTGVTGAAVGCVFTNNSQYGADANAVGSGFRFGDCSGGGNGFGDLRGYGGFATGFSGWLQGSGSSYAVPSSGVNTTNPFSVDCMVFIRGGTVSNIAISGASTSATSGMFIVKAGQYITLTYTVAPTWDWFGI